MASIWVSMPSLNRVHRELRIIAYAVSRTLFGIEVEPLNTLVDSKRSMTRIIAEPTY